MLRFRAVATLVVVSVVAFYLGSLLVFQYGGFAPSWVQSLLLYHPPSHALDTGLLQEEFRQIQEHYVDANPNGATLTTAAARGMVTGLNDQFSRFQTSQEYKQSQSFLQGSFAGIGATVLLKNNQLQIAGVLPNTPAQHAGLRAGDLILSVDGVSTKGMTEDQAVQRVRGQAGTHVILGLQRNGQDFKADLVRANISVPSLGTHIFNNQVLYVHIFDFGDRTASEFDQALKDNLKGNVDRVVLDLRDNPGGFVDASVDVISEFVKSGNAVILVGRDGKEQPKSVSGSGLAFTQRLVVMVNADTASAAEITAGALKDDGRGVIVGVKTFGKGSVQEDFLMRGGEDLHLTIAHWITPKRHLIDKNGITPDRIVTLAQPTAEYAVDQAGSDPSKDAQLQAALTIAEG
jgi:carboxyl-terminal processing protease